jgi:hypothetical protein
LIACKWLWFLRRLDGARERPQPLEGNMLQSQGMRSFKHPLSRVQAFSFAIIFRDQTR